MVDPTEIPTADRFRDDDERTFYGTSCAALFVNGLMGMIKLFSSDAPRTKVEVVVRA